MGAIDTPRERMYLCRVNIELKIVAKQHQENACKSIDGRVIFLVHPYAACKLVIHHKNTVVLYRQHN